MIPRHLTKAELEGRRTTLRQEIEFRQRELRDVEAALHALHIKRIAEVSERARLRKNPPHWLDAHEDRREQFEADEMAATPERD